jgi:hypothetical protein
MTSQWRPRCAICTEFVKLEESKTDERGQAIHEECYVQRVLNRRQSNDADFSEQLKHSA